MDDMVGDFSNLDISEASNGLEVILCNVIEHFSFFFFFLLIWSVIIEHFFLSLFYFMFVSFPDCTLFSLTRFYPNRFSL